MLFNEKSLPNCSAETSQFYVCSAVTWLLSLSKYHGSRRVFVTAAALIGQPYNPL